jgi:hypothetical protein
MIRRWWLLLALVLLSGCSAIKLAYQQLPTLSYWWLDNYLSFSDAQTPRVKESLEYLQRWHRQQELPLYTQLINRVAQSSQGNIQAQDACTLWSDGQARADRLVQEALRQTAPVIATLSPRQLSHLTRHFGLKNEDWEKQWLRGNNEERFKRRLSMAVDRYSDFYGDLTPSQTALLQSQMSQSEWTPEWGLQQRKRQQQDLLAALQKIQQQNLSSAQLEAELQGVWQRWFLPPQASDAALVQRLRTQACQNLADFHNSTSAEQRQRAARRLRSYERDLLDLMRS